MKLLNFWTGVLLVFTTPLCALAFDCGPGYEAVAQRQIQTIFLQVGRKPQTQDEFTRVASTAGALNRALEPNEISGLLQAHEVGSESPLGRDGINPPGILANGKTNYSNRQIALKAAILRKAGFGELELRKILDLGLAGRKIKSESGGGGEAPAPRDPKVLASTIKAQPGLEKVQLKPEFLTALEAALKALPPTSNVFDVRMALADTMVKQSPGELLGSREISALQTAAALWHAENVTKPATAEAAPAVKPLSPEQFASAMRVDPTLVAENLPLTDGFWEALQTAVGKLPTTDKFSFRGAVVEVSMTYKPEGAKFLTEPQKDLLVNWLLANANARPRKVAPPPPIGQPVVASATRPAVREAAPVAPPAPRAAKDWYTSDAAKKPLNNSRKTGEDSVVEMAAKNGTPFLFAVIELEDGRVIRLTTPYVAGAGHEGMARWLKNKIAAQFGYYGVPGMKRVLGAGEARAEIIDGKVVITELNETSGWAVKDAKAFNHNDVAKLIPFWNGLEPGLVVAGKTKGKPFDTASPHTQHFDKELADFMVEIHRRAAELGIEDNFRHAVGGFVGNVLDIPKGPLMGKSLEESKYASKSLTLVFRMVERDRHVWEEGKEATSGGGTRYGDMKKRMDRLAAGETLPDAELAQLKEDLRKYYATITLLGQDPERSVDALEIRSANPRDGIIPPPPTVGGW